jgi:hypothetical protein
MGDMFDGLQNFFSGGGDGNQKEEYNTPKEDIIVTIPGRLPCAL